VPARVAATTATGIESPGVSSALVGVTCTVVAICRATTEIVSAPSSRPSAASARTATFAVPFACTTSGGVLSGNAASALASAMLAPSALPSATITSGAPAGARNALTGRDASRRPPISARSPRLNVGTPAAVFTPTTALSAAVSGTSSIRAPAIALPRASCTSTCGTMLSPRLQAR
jgi:hypothetical protein